MTMLKIVLKDVHRGPLAVVPDCAALHTPSRLGFLDTVNHHFLHFRRRLSVEPFPMEPFAADAWNN